MIVAVFGRDDATPADLDTARSFGAAIVAAGAVLLTGGVGNGAALIKEQAIEGAVDGTDEPRWIGVENSDLLAPSRRARGGGVVVSPGCGHRRNFIGAALCDVAIALAGEDGTASEIVFALALGRPVVMYGDGWRAGSDNLPALVEAAQRRAPPTDGAALIDRAIAAAYAMAGHRSPAVVAGGLPAADVVQGLLHETVDSVSPDVLLALRDADGWDALLARRAAALLPPR